MENYPYDSPAPGFYVLWEPSERVWCLRWANGPLALDEVCPVWRRETREEVTDASWESYGGGDIQRGPPPNGCKPAQPHRTLGDDAVVRAFRAETTRMQEDLDRGRAQRKSVGTQFAAIRDEVHRLRFFSSSLKRMIEAELGTEKQRLDAIWEKAEKLAEDAMCGKST